MIDASTGIATVRERVDADLPGAAAALVEVHATDGYPVEGVDDPQAWLTGPTLLCAWVGELDGRIVGHIAVSRPQPDDAAATLWTNTPEGAHDTVAVVGRLFVQHTARGRALGDKLMQAVTDYADCRGLRLVLDVMTKDAAAIRLYERRGWRRTGTTDHDDGKGRLVPAVCFVSTRATGQT